MKMRISIMFFPIIFLLSFSKKEKIKSIQIRKMDFITSLPTRIPCDEFDKEGPAFIDTFNFVDEKTINLLLSDLNSAISTQSKYSGIDTRAKILIFFSSGKRDSLCIGTTPVFIYHNKLMEFKSLKLRDFVKSLPSKDW